MPKVTIKKEMEAATASSDDQLAAFDLGVGDVDVGRLGSRRGGRKSNERK